MFEDSSILGSLPSSKESLLGLDILVVLLNMCGEAAQDSLQIILVTLRFREQVNQSPTFCT